ncbi:hypothetical protein OG976_14990 [Mycobacterium sp. NBC_00419]|uniref:hypothetical protein n=1 Tax=Mycobacterium sp. NBC_00419 TaxID=2975989 RepID=UPI002E23491A
MTQAHRRAVRWVVPGYALILAVAVTAPLLAPGYLLLRDAVSTPRAYLSDAALGLSEAAPRALPQDFLVAIASTVIDGGMLVKALVVAGLFLAGWGAARLAADVVPEAGLPGQLVATTLGVWNPYVGERLLQGHWSLLVGYGCLPWVAASVIRLRTGDDNPRWPVWAAAVFWIAVAGLTPTGLILAAVVAGVCIAVRGHGVSRVRCLAGIAAASTVAALPWLTAAAVGDAVGASATSGLAAFAARAEPGLGTLGSLAGLGGIWNAEAVPASRTTFLALLATVVLLTVVTLGLPAVIRRPTAVPLLILAVVSVVGPAVMATGPGLAVLRAVVDAAPGLGVLRDGQKWVALAMPGYAVAGAGAVVTARAWTRPGVAAAVAIAALIAVLPDLAWGVAGKVTPVHYPRGWPAVVGIVNADPGAVAVLPADTMRRFGWAGPAPVLDPLPRWVRPEVLTTGDLTISGQTVPGEGARAREIQRMLVAGAGPQEIAAAGVRWVVVEGGTAGEVGSAQRTLDALPVIYQDADLTLYRAGGTSPVAAQSDRLTMIVVHLAWLALLTASAVAMAVARVRRA